VAALVNLFQTGTIWQILTPTLATLGIGLGIAIVAGIPIGLLVGRSDVLYYLTQPVINILQSVPYVTFLPLLIFWFGLGVQSQVVVVVWSSIIPIIVNTRQGGRSLDRDYVRVAKVFNAPPLKSFFWVALPATIPYILAGLRLAISMALIGAIVAEFFLGSDGIGYYIQSQTSLLRMDNAMAAIAILVTIAFLLNWIVSKVETRYRSWAG
jgi:ABC-type nitrate/sulfonate/bicarbonate transport system permease component